MIKVELDSLSVTGRRSMNQDCALTFGKPGGIFAVAVADGMGGTNGGEIASALTCKAVKEKVESSVLTTEINLKSVIEEVFTEAQKLISLKKLEEPEIATLGTTLVCLIVENSRYAWGNIGDSRLYKITEQGVELLTRDHTLINEIFDKTGRVTPEEVASQSHVLTRSLDGGKDQPDIFPPASDYSLLQGGELFLACSDGAILEKHSTDHFWLSRLSDNSGSLKEFLNQVIEYAFENGSTDNITVAALNYGYVFKNQHPNPSGENKNSEKLNPLTLPKSKLRNKILRVSMISTLAILLVSLILLTNRRLGLSLLPGESEIHKKGLNADTIAIPNENNISSDRPGSIKGDADFFKHIQNGNEFLRKNQLKKALLEFEQALEIDPGDPSLKRIIIEINEKLQLDSTLKAMSKAEEEKEKEANAKKKETSEKGNINKISTIPPPETAVSNSNSNGSLNEINPQNPINQGSGSDEENGAGKNSVNSHAKGDNASGEVKNSEGEAVEDPEKQNPPPNSESEGKTIDPQKTEPPKSETNRTRKKIKHQQ